MSYSNTIRHDEKTDIQCAHIDNVKIQKFMEIQKDARNVKR